MTLYSDGRDFVSHQTMDLETFLAVYENPEEISNIQAYVNRKKEFSELRPPRNESPPQPGEYYQHQELVGRLSLLLDQFLLIHRTGTGKTCAMVKVAEYFRKNPGRIRRAYVLTRGTVLVRDFRKQIVERCTKDEYITPDILTRTKLGQKILINRKVKEWYDLTTYISFANSVLGGVDVPVSAITDEVLIQMFHDTIFFVDEVHNLRSALGILPQEHQEAPPEQPPVPGSSEREMASSEGRNPKRKKKKKKEERDLVRAYHLIWRIFHRVPGVKVILATATPMVNRVEDLYPIMNLILPEELQMSRETIYMEDDFSDLVVQLRPYLNGRVSYVREADIGVKVVFMGNRTTYRDPETGDPRITHSIVYASTMSAYQTKVYDYWYEREGGQKQRRGGVYIAERQSTIFTYPAEDRRGNIDYEHAIGKRGFETFIIEGPPGYYRMSRELLQAVTKEDGLANLSIIFDSILTLADEGVGETVYCFLEFVYSGTILLGLCAETRGYVPFDPSQYRPDPSKMGQRGSFLMTKEKRYAVITGEDTEGYIDAVLEVLNSPLNLHGEYIKLIIASPFVKEGMSFANVQQIHLGPDWHMSGIYQALSRAIRATSHVDLLKEERERLLEEGRDPDEAEVVVKIYQHVAEPLETIAGPDTYSIGLAMFVAAEEKDIPVARMLRLLKMWSVDCPFMRERNIHSEDVDETPICDYMRCNYPCADLPDPRPPALLDTSTYFPLYSLSDARRLFPELAARLAEQGQTDVNPTDEVIASLKTVYPFVTRELLIVSLWSLMNSDSPQPDAFGIPRYPKLVGTDLVLSPLHPSDRIPLTSRGLVPTLANYSQRLDVTGTIPLREVAYDIYKEDQDDIIDELLHMSPDDPEYEEYLALLFRESKIALVERAIIATVYRSPDDPPLPGADAIIKRYEDSIFRTWKPEEQINRVHERISETRVSRGRKLQRAWNIMTDPRLKGMEVEEEENDTPVYVHTLYSTIYAQAAYAATTRARRPDGMLRVLDTSDYTLETPLNEIHFRETQPAEGFIYNRLIQSQRGDIFSAFDNVSLHGTLIKNAFRIVDKAYQDPERQNARTSKKGLICTSWEMVPLIGVMQRLDIPAPDEDVNIDVEDPRVTREWLIKNIVRMGRVPLKSFEKVEDIDFIRYMFRWIYTGHTKAMLCRLIQKRLSEMGRLIEIRVG